MAGKGAYSNDPDAGRSMSSPSPTWTDGMRRNPRLHPGGRQRLIGRRLDIGSSGGRPERAALAGVLRHGAPAGKAFFDYNVGVLGRRWFANGVTEDTDSLIIHELGHELCGNHADENYFRALTKLGARLKAAALAEPEWFGQFRFHDQNQEGRQPSDARTLVHGM